MESSRSGVLGWLPVGRAVVRRTTRPKTVLTIVVLSIFAFTVLLIPTYYRRFGCDPQPITPQDIALTPQIDETLLTETEQQETQIAPPSTLTEESQISSSSTSSILSEVPSVSALPVQLEPWDSSFFVNGLPTESVRENLRNDTKYLASWIAAGWTNDVMTYVNLIYLAMITDRVPILGPFTPSHGEDLELAFSDVFDLPRMRTALRTPILEWHEVKAWDSEFIDEIGCWSVWETVSYEDRKPRESYTPHLLRLDISYTKAPDYIKLTPGNPHDKCSTFWSLATLAYPTKRNENLVTPHPSPRNKVSLPPDEHLLCYDYLYYVCAHEGFDFDKDYSPAFRHVARHMYWTPRLEGLATDTLRTTFGLGEEDEIPPYITIHVRHGEFTMWCEVPVEEGCFASLPVIARRVDEVKAELVERKGVAVTHVVMTSDERDAGWWRDVRALGWFRLRYSVDRPTFGTWNEPLIDAIVQSHGVGFVGTDRSTFSMMADKRVSAWHDGAVRYFKWGKPGADDH